LALCDANNKGRKILVSYIYQNHDFTNVDIILAFEHIGFVLESSQGQFFTHVRYRNKHAIEISIK
jgi:hypothetical protein